MSFDPVVSFFHRKSIEESTLVDIDIEKVRKRISWGKKKLRKVSSQTSNPLVCANARIFTHAYPGEMQELLVCLAMFGHWRTCNKKLTCLFFNDFENKHCYFQILDATFKECRKENPSYKMAALKCFGEIVQDYSIDRFQQISELLFPIISPVSMINYHLSLCFFNYNPQEDFLINPINGNGSLKHAPTPKCTN